jgi:DNA-binding transcriptional ArsR family regulator
MKSQGRGQSLVKLRRQSVAVAGILKQLSHPQRLAILCALSESEKSVGEIERVCGASQSAVSQFLKGMRLEGLIEARREGKRIYYRIADERVEALIKSLCAIFSK